MLTCITKLSFSVIVCYFHWHLLFGFEICGNDFWTLACRATFLDALTCIFIEKFGYLRKTWS